VSNRGTELIGTFEFGTIDEDLRSWMWMFSVSRNFSGRVISSHSARLLLGGGLCSVTSSDHSYAKNT